MQKITPELKQKILNICHVTILILSVLLIVYISYDTFHNIMFLSNRNYMNFQLFVCVVFILDFFFELLIADDKWSYTKRRLVFLILSIPYLNIIHTRYSSAVTRYILCGLSRWLAAPSPLRLYWAIFRATKSRAFSRHTSR